MKPLFKFNFLVALVCLVMLGSCSDEDTDPPKTDAELIGSGIAWKYNAITANGVSIASLIDACHLDNLITFNYETPVSTGVVDSGTTKCDDSQPQTVDFTWDYNESTKVLTTDTDLIEVPGSEGNLTVESVNSNQLVLSQNVALPGFGTQKVMLTLDH